MQMTYEPGDGSIDIILDADEPVPEKYKNAPCASIWRRVGTKLKCVKPRG